MTETVYFLWQGGASYGESRMPEDLEMVDTREAAEGVFTDRYEMNGACALNTYYTNQENDDTYYFPAVHTDCYMLVYLYDPRTVEGSDPYPDLRVSYIDGPEGKEVQWEAC